jgi:hypothetical protein
MAIFKHQQHKIDRRRLSLFDLPGDELPFESLVTWGMSIWPAKMPLPGQPRDAYADSFFDETNAFVMTGGELEDEEAVQTSLALFGIVSRPQLCLLLATNHRLIWLPIDGTRPTYRSGSYPRYDAAVMSSRWVNLSDFDYAELVGMPEGELPDGLVTSLAIRFAFAASGDNPIHGPGWPRFDLHDIEEFAHESLAQPCALFAVTTIAEPMLDFFMLGLAEAGFTVLPPEYPVSLRANRRKWSPLHEKVERPS